MKQGFTMPVEINITFHSKHQHFTVLIATTIIPQRPGRTKPMQLEGGGVNKNQCSKVR